MSRFRFLEGFEGGWVLLDVPLDFLVTVAFIFIFEFLPGVLGRTLFTFLPLPFLPLLPFYPCLEAVGNWRVPFDQAHDIARWVRNRSCGVLDDVLGMLQLRDHILSRFQV